MARGPEIPVIRGFEVVGVSFMVAGDGWSPGAAV
jgi:hypothetical protein